VTRVSQKDLRETVSRLQASGLNISIEWAYGRPRIMSRDGASDISPRLSTGEMATWLDGYEAGLDGLRPMLRDVCERLVIAQSEAR
jgi:hypothetical protein